MTDDENDIEAALATLRTAAPPTLRPAVLVEVGRADLYARFDSPIGPLVVAWNGLGVSAVEAADDDETFEATHRARTGRPADDAGVLPPRLASAISRRLDGDRRVRIDLDLRGHTDFERDVWHKALEIPRGEVRPYGWVAAEIGRPKAVRAVGTALGHNPVPLIVPCHRVVRSDGTIGQYSLGGPGNKRTILRTEGLDPDGLESAARSGVRFVGSDTTHVVCLPTCHAAQRITPAHRVPFRSFDHATAAGYTACRHCRPGSGVLAA
jgi:O-6-methylguanine DNA methyltransferase